MKTLTPAQTEFVSGSLVRDWPMPHRTGLPALAGDARPSGNAASERSIPRQWRVREMADSAVEGRDGQPGLDAERVKFRQSIAV